MKRSIHKVNTMTVSVKKAARDCIECKIPDLPLRPKSILIPQLLAISRTKDSDLCVFSWSVMKIHPADGLVAMMVAI